MNLINVAAMFYRRALRSYYKLALAQLTRKNACHPDVPYLVHRINDLKEK